VVEVYRHHEENLIIAPTIGYRQSRWVWGKSLSKKRRGGGKGKEKKRLNLHKERSDAIEVVMGARAR